MIIIFESEQGEQFAKEIISGTVPRTGEYIYVESEEYPDGAIFEVMRVQYAWRHGVFESTVQVMIREK